MLKGNKWKLIFQSYTGIQMGGAESAPPPAWVLTFHMPAWIGLNEADKVALFLKKAGKLNSI